jgi:hypothetical protein
LASQNKPRICADFRRIGVADPSKIRRIRVNPWFQAVRQTRSHFLQCPRQAKSETLETYKHPWEAVDAKYIEARDKRTPLILCFFSMLRKFRLSIFCQVGIAISRFIFVRFDFVNLPGQPFPNHQSEGADYAHRFSIAGHRQPHALPAR